MCDVSWCPSGVEGSERTETGDLWMDVIRTQMTNVLPAKRGNYNHADEHNILKICFIVGYSHMHML